MGADPHRFRFVGRPLPRADGPDKVTGTAVFATDLLPRGVLWAKILHSPLAHARILHIDTSRAKRLPGVHAVITARDISPRLIGGGLRDTQVLARDRVLFVGDKVAAVAAAEKDIVEEALGLIHVEYDELPAVFDPLKAMEPDAPLLHPDYDDYKIADPHAKAVGLRNVQSVTRARKGDVELGFAESDFIFEHTFQTQMVHQGYLEPAASLVDIDPEGNVHVWATQQSPFSVRNQLADYLDLPEEKVVYHPVMIGGSFGGKVHLLEIPIAYHLAQLTKRPVVTVKTYTEELMAGSPRHPSVVFLKSGVKKDGRLCAREARVVYNGGAYGSYKPTPRAHMNGGLTQGGAYRVPHTRLESFCVYTNQVPGGYMRASGELQTVFAVESHMDMIAADLGLDPLEIRLRNAMIEGDSSYSGFAYNDIQCLEVLAAARKFWRRPKPFRRRRGILTGRGIALSCRHIAYGEAAAEVLLRLDGTVHLVTGIVDQGVGVHVIQKQIVAEILGVVPERVTVQIGDTNRAPYHDGIKGQGATHTIGQAVARATSALIETLKARAANRWNVAPDKVEWKQGRAVRKGREEQLDLVQLAKLAPGEPGRGYFFYNAPRRPHEHIFQAEIADVEVDRETGEVKVMDIASFHDVSVVINPLTHQGQIEGGLIQGLGMALCEEMVVEEGRVATLSLGEYKIPSISDIPTHKTALVAKASHGPGPFQAKAAAEHSITPVPPAVANAVYDATGVRITALPITAEKVLAGIRANPMQQGSLQREVRRC